MARFQSLNRAYKRSDQDNQLVVVYVPYLFQSLNRAYKRSDVVAYSQRPSQAIVSIPQSGLQAFRHLLDGLLIRYYLQFQSLNRAYKRSDCVILNREVSPKVFQSLNRAYKRSDPNATNTPGQATHVSIPQSGLQAFRQNVRMSYGVLPFPFQSLNRAYKRSDGDMFILVSNVDKFQSLNRAYKRSDHCPENGRPYFNEQFQSLNRAYKRSDNERYDQAVARDDVSIPQSGLQAFRLSVNAVYMGEVHVSIPQSGLQAFRRGTQRALSKGMHLVSIPQSGLQAFRLSRS